MSTIFSVATVSLHRHNPRAVPIGALRVLPTAFALASRRSVYARPSTVFGRTRARGRPPVGPGRRTGPYPRRNKQLRSMRRSGVPTRRKPPSRSCAGSVTRMRQQSGRAPDASRPKRHNPDHRGSMHRPPFLVRLIRARRHRDELPCVPTTVAIPLSGVSPCSRCAHVPPGRGARCCLRCGYGVGSSGEGTPRPLNDANPDFSRHERSD